MAQSKRFRICMCRKGTEEFLICVVCLIWMEMRRRECALMVHAIIIVMRMADIKFDDKIAGTCHCEVLNLIVFNIAISSLCIIILVRR
jgi:hypothetical protein